MLYKAVCMFLLCFVARGCFQSECDYAYNQSNMQTLENI